METIIYIFLDKTSNEKKWTNGFYYKEEYNMRDYHLVRVGVSADFMRILQERPAESPSPKSVKGFGLRAFRARKQERIREQQRQQKLMEEAKLRQRFVQEIVTKPDCSYFVCEEPIPFLEGWSFGCYREDEWVMHMMEYATLPHFMIFGRANCLPGLLVKHIHRMKSLRWILPERQFGVAEQELVEDIYEQYGLAVEVQLLVEESDYRRIQPMCRFPTVIVDFSGEDRMHTADIAKGSIWLDMDASETKRSRLEERNAGISYFSLKKEWKQPQKALYQLDTNHKNGYNT